jgi:hypothetical protein
MGMAVLFNPRWAGTEFTEFPRWAGTEFTEFPLFLSIMSALCILVR